MKKTLLALSIPALLGALMVPASARPPEAPSTVGAHYVEPSTTQVLKPGDKIADLFTRNMGEGYVLQKLTPRTYWYQSGFYGTTFYVGDKGVLLFDPLEGRAEPMLKAIASVTNKPVAAIVYSHNHGDHIGGTPALLEKLAGQKQRPHIIASAATAEKMAVLSSQLPKVDEVVAWPRGEFSFEGLKVQLHGFPRAAHTDDHSAWLLVGERVLHAPDLLNPDQPPFWSFAGSERFLYLESNLKEADALAWDHFNGGHGNVGSHADFAFHLSFINDLKEAVGKVMNEVPFGFGVDANAINAHTVMLPAWYGEISRRATEALRPKYGQYYGFDTATPANAEMVAEYLYNYR